MSHSKQSQFDDLVERVAHCSLCPRMSSRKKVLTASNGNLDSKIIFVAEAPGRLGADKYGIPLYGDQTGKNFESLLGYAGLTRDSVFITNAVLCNPRSENGNNSSPTTIEIQNCSDFLNDTIRLINPDYIVTLGTKALYALNFISTHTNILSTDVGNIFSWENYCVFPLYHPGPRALIRRPMNQQIHDYQTLAAIVKI